jgi:tripeptide aminopeptidase
MALDFVAEFVRGETEYFWFSELTAKDGNAHLTVMIRDFDKIEFECRKRRIGEADAEFLHWRAQLSFAL